jgi:hypothetical protein
VLLFIKLLKIILVITSVMGGELKDISMPEFHRETVLYLHRLYYIVVLRELEKLDWSTITHHLTEMYGDIPEDSGLMDTLDRASHSLTISETRSSVSATCWSCWTDIRCKCALRVRSSIGALKRFMSRLMFL